MGGMTISLQFASLYNSQEVFVWPNCLLDLGMDKFLVGNMVFVCSNSSNKGVKRIPK